MRIRQAISTFFFFGCFAPLPGSADEPKPPPSFVDEFDKMAALKNVIDRTSALFASARSDSPHELLTEVHGCLIDGFLIRSEKPVSEKGVLVPCPDAYSGLPQKVLVQLTVPDNAAMYIENGQYRLYAPRFGAADWLNYLVANNLSAASLEMRNMLGISDVEKNTASPSQEGSTRP